ncbi:MAG: C4-type zinc ribbon domain-containing protein [Acidimicrobiaceae bacterium]|nr:C4-type zinc ribbon domain-containing protein [Acidimicrobiaceae bacterium]
MADPAMEALLALQDIDQSLDQLRHRRQTLPERTELEQLAARGVHLEGERATVAAERDELAAREQAIEDEMNAADTRASEVERRMYSGEVSASRELTAMAEDVTSLRARSSDLEDRALEILGEREPLDARLAAFDAELADLRAAAAKARSGLAAAEEEIDRELALVGERRATAAAAVPAGLLPEYDRLRARLGGVAVARLVGSRCDGCHLTLPATEIDHIRHQPPDTVVHCDNCGRILVRP